MRGREGATSKIAGASAGRFQRALSMEFVRAIRTYRMFELAKGEEPMIMGLLVMAWSSFAPAQAMPPSRPTVAMMGDSHVDLNQGLVSFTAPSDAHITGSDARDGVASVWFVFGDERGQGSRCGLSIKSDQIDGVGSQRDLNFRTRISLEIGRFGGGYPERSVTPTDVSVQLTTFVNGDTGDVDSEPSFWRAEKWIHVFRRSQVWLVKASCTSASPEIAEEALAATVSGLIV